jgi:hypothetical protein
LYRKLGIFELLARKRSEHKRDEVRDVVEARRPHGHVTVTIDGDPPRGEGESLVDEKLRPQAGEECRGREAELRCLSADRDLRDVYRFRTAVSRHAELGGHEELHARRRRRRHEPRLQGEREDARGGEEDINALELGDDIGGGDVEGPDLGTFRGERPVSRTIHRLLHDDSDRCRDEYGTQFSPAESR